MANPTVLTDAVIWYGGYDLSGASNEITMNAARQENPDSRFSDTVETVYPGPMTVSVEAKGLWDSALDGPQFTQLTAPSESWPLTICADGGDNGEASYSIEAYSFNYSALEAQWGEVLPYRLSAKSKSGGELHRGRCSFPKATITASSPSAKFQHGALSASQKMVVTTHVFAVDGDWTVYAISDADAGAGGETARGNSPVSITSAPSSDTFEVAGPVTDTYWYVNVGKNSGTSITCAVAFAIVEA